MLISVIIPTYNSAHTIEMCLDGIFQQSFKDFEIIIIDSASEDDTVKIIEYYKSLGNRINYISEKDDGIYDAMNKGIYISKGKYLYFMGSDDTLYDENVFQAISTYLKTNNFDMIYGDVKWGETDQIYDGDFGKYKIIFQNICHQSIFYKKNMILKLGNYSKNYPILADYALNLEIILSNKYIVKYVPLIIAEYSLSGISSAKYDDNFFKDRESILNKYLTKDFIILLNQYNKKLYEIEYIKTETKKVIESKDREISMIYNSKSFRLGFNLLHPWNFVKKNLEKYKKKVEKKSI